MAKKVQLQEIYLGQEGESFTESVNENFEQVDKALDNLDGETVKNRSITQRLDSSAIRIPSNKAVSDALNNYATKGSITKFKGYHTTDIALKGSYPQSETKKDDFAWVGYPYPGYVWKVDADGGAWRNTGEKPPVVPVDLSEYVKWEIFLDVSKKASEMIGGNRAYINNISEDYVIDSYYPISEDSWEGEIEPIANNSTHLKLVSKTKLRNKLPINQELQVNVGIDKKDDISGTVFLIDANSNKKELGQFANGRGLKKTFNLESGEYQHLVVELIIDVNYVSGIELGDLIYLGIGFRASILEVHDYFENANVVQSTGTSTTEVMSQKAVSEAIEIRALTRKEDGSTVLYLTPQGNLPDGLVPLVSNEMDGLMSKEIYKDILEMKENSMDLRKKFGNHVICGFDNETIGDGFIFIQTQTLIGAPEFVICNSEIIREGMLDAYPTFIPHFFTRPNDIITAYMNDVDKIFLSTSTNLSFVHIRTLPTSKLNIISLVNSSIKGVNFDDFASVKEIYATGSKRLKGVELLRNKQLKIVNFDKATEMEFINIQGGQDLTSLRLSDSPKLKSASISNGNTPSLKNVFIDGTVIPKYVLLTLETKWMSRVGKDTGILKLSKALYDTMSSEERKRFTDKNITFDIVA